MYRPVSRKAIFYTCNTPTKELIYIIRGEDGDLLIDTGTEQSVREVEEFALRYNVKYIFLTHGHFDHAWNAKYFREKYGWKIILHEKDLGIYRNEEPQAFYPTCPDNTDIAAYADELIETVKIPFCDVDYAVSDSDTDLLRKLGFDADIVTLPGHTKGSMGILQYRTLYIGDACSAVNGDYFRPFFGTDIRNVKKTEAKIVSLSPLVLAPGHGRLVIYDKTSFSSL